jgi:hypothetical protein
MVYLSYENFYPCYSSLDNLFMLHNIIFHSTLLLLSGTVSLNLDYKKGKENILLYNHVYVLFMSFNY